MNETKAVPKAVEAEPKAAELPTTLPMPCFYQARIDYVKAWDWAPGTIIQFVPVGSVVHAVVVPKSGTKLLSIDLKHIELGPNKPEKTE